MGIELHRSDRPQELVTGFARLLRESPADVFAPEVVIVPARGVERWMTQQLSHSLGATGSADGVCAGLRIMTAGSLVSLLLDREREDPWQVDRLVWPCLLAIDELCGSAGFEALTRHLGAGDPLDDPRAEWDRQARHTRRYAVARRLASLFAAYNRERPGMVADWEAGGATDGFGAPLPADLVWQPPLWRQTVELVAQLHGTHETMQQRHRRVVAGLRDGSLHLDLPHRLSFFGYTRMPAADLQLIAALGTHREVHLWLPHPSAALWDGIAAGTSAVVDAAGPVARVDDRTATLAAHPLLATLGRDIRELEQCLLALAPAVHPPLSHEHPTRTRLQLLQADIRANRRPDPTRVIAPGDRSLQVHACHGRARQVEVLREVLTWLVAQGKGDLQPRDILVLCPDIEEFAPLVQATFGLAVVPDTVDAQPSAHPGQRLRVQLADRSLGATNPLIELAHRVVELVAGRMTATELLDFAGQEAVRRRFGFDEDGLARIARWVTNSGVRWGYDATHRGEYGLGGLDANTWMQGLDRIAIGVAVAADSDGLSGGHVPIDDIGSRDIELVGRFVELVERVKDAADAVRGRGTAGAGPKGSMVAADWMLWLGTAIEGLGDTAPDQQWQFAQIDRELAAIAAAAGDRITLRLSDVRSLLQQRWAGRPTRSNFRTGAITVCSMVPMRSVPHRAVVVLGLDDGVYPRSPVIDGDDVLARGPRVGERDVRSEDRQLLLDAVMAAGDYFVGIYSGTDERTGEARPPAVPLQELIAVADRTASGGDTFVRRHPLQAFDERNFVPDGPLPGGTFDSAALAGALALRRFHDQPVGRAPFLEQPLEERVAPAVTVDDLIAFLQNPAREFLRHRLQLSVPRDLEETNDALPIELDGLQRWAIGDRVLEEVVGGSPLEQAMQRELVRGSLPPGNLGDDARKRVQTDITWITRDLELDAPGPWPGRRSVDIRLEIPRERRGGTTRFTGVIGGVQGDEIRVHTYSRIGSKHIVAAWVRLLALAVAEPNRTHSAVLRGGRQSSARLRSPGAAAAASILDQLLAARQSGMRFPIGAPPKTAQNFAGIFRKALRSNSPETAFRIALDRVRTDWEGDRFAGENDDPYWNVVLGRRSSVESLDRFKALSYFAPLIWNPIDDHLEGA